MARGGRRVLRPSAKNGFLQERLSKLSPAPLSNHGLHYELPKHPSLRWATPGQGRHKVYGDSRRGGWAGHLWAVCWSLGPERWRRLVWRNLHTHTQRGQSRQWLETPEVSEIPGNELRVGKQEEASKAILGRPASSRSVRSPWTGGWREWRDSPPETGFQQDSPFLHWDLEKAPGQRERGGWRGGWIRRRGEGRQQGPRVRRRPEATGERLLPRQQLRSRSEKAFAGKGLTCGRERHCCWGRWFGKPWDRRSPTGAQSSQEGTGKTCTRATLTLLQAWGRGEEHLRRSDTRTPLLLRSVKHTYVLNCRESW